MFWKSPGTNRISHVGLVTKVNTNGTLKIFQSTVNRGGVSINGKSNASSDGTLWKGTKYQLDFVGAGRPSGEGKPLREGKPLVTFNGLTADYSNFVSMLDGYVSSSISTMTEALKSAESTTTTRAAISSVNTITPGGVSLSPSVLPPGGTITPVNRIIPSIIIPKPPIKT